MTSLGRGGAMDWLPAEIKRNRSGLCDVNHETNETSMKGVYAVGDSMQVSTIIQAIADGKRAATAILKANGQMRKRKDLWDAGADNPSKPGIGYTPPYTATTPRDWARWRLTTPSAPIA